LHTPIVQGRGDGPKAGTRGASEAPEQSQVPRPGGLFRLNSLDFLPPNIILPHKMT